ncbi:hypothetical protein B0O99DRAFT_597074 [Bisporella sp. PMI_857]|nr:hypothetical protein B0O99DRAFT_597074 [Bisporella sp. PMI_857]
MAKNNSNVTIEADLMRAFQGLVTNIGDLTSNDNYKTIAGVFGEIPRLKEVIELKDSELVGLRREITELRSKYENRLQDNLEMYRKQQNNLEKENATSTTTILNLESVIKEKNVASEEHTRAQNVLQEKLEQVTKLLDAEKKKVAGATADVSKLQQIIKGKDLGIDKLKESLRNEKVQKVEANNQTQELEKKITSLERDLQSSATRLDEIESFTTKLREVDEAVINSSFRIKRLDEVWEAAYGAVVLLFEEDLAEERLGDKTAWKHLKDSEHLDRAIPLPRSNSLAAKHMRVAALLAILARSISQHIFQPTYLLEDNEDRDEIRSLLVNLAVTNSKKESFCRALLLSIFPEDQAKNSAKAVEQVVREVAWCVRNLVFDAQFEKFRSDVEGVVRKALDVWHLVQNTREKFEPYFELNHYLDFEWHTLRFDNSRVSAGNENTANASKDDEALLMIFPRIYVIADGEPDPVTPGVVLMKSQSIPAAEEMERNSPSSPVAGKAGPRSREIRSRAMSNSANAANAANGFLSKKLLPGV